ncbi:MAG: hypothetical protein ABW250_11775 [Pyrinomonadaceae bacterium]
MGIFISQPEAAFRVGDFINSHLRQEEWTEFRAAIAFVKLSGVRHVREALREFSCRARVKISVGIDLGGTSKEGLVELLRCVDKHGEVWVFHNENASTFHPKVYLFKGKDRADLVVGSGNLTEGGLFTNYEASLAVSLDLTLEGDRALLGQVEAMLDGCSDPAHGVAKPLTEEFIEQLVENGYVPTEKQAREMREAAGRAVKPGGQKERPPLFNREPTQTAPRVVRESGAPTGDTGRPATGQQILGFTPSTAQTDGETHRGFLMLLQNTDVGVGQVTPGASKRSPEIFIPVAAVRPVRARRAQGCDPEFWGWESKFTDDPLRDGKKDRQLRILFEGAVLDAVLWYNPDKMDYRLRNNTLRDAGNVGDVLQIERADTAAGWDYTANVIRQGTPEHAEALRLCVNMPQNSQKRWGYY